MAVSTSDRRDVFRRQRSETSEVAVDYPARLPPTTGDVAADSVKAMIDQISGASVTEIERLVAELSSVRDMLHNEAERVQRQVADHASASQAAMTAMKVIADSLADWKLRNRQGRP
jgi:ubiquinone biosynthesis protein UbiJ